VSRIGGPDYVWGPRRGFTLASEGEGRSLIWAVAEMTVGPGGAVPDCTVTVNRPGPNRRREVVVRSVSLAELAFLVGHARGLGLGLSEPATRRRLLPWEVTQ